MKDGIIPLMWRKFFLKVANNRDFVYNFCNRTLNNFDRYCREWYLYNSLDADDIRMLDKELKIAHWLVL